MKKIDKVDFGAIIHNATLIAVEIIRLFREYYEPIYIILWIIYNIIIATYFTLQTAQDVKDGV
ncbi:MAG: hypothetical protein ACFFG0_55780, partial [Candidatus Thorarchaeota archaeon]